MGDLDAFHTESVLADLEIVERRLGRARKERAPAQEIDGLEQMKATLESERPLRSIPPEQLGRAARAGYGFLTDKPLLIAVNREESKADGDLAPELSSRIAALDAAGMALSASVEAEIASLDPREQALFLEDMGLTDAALSRFIRTAYGLVDLISFVTVGSDEVRAWTIRRGTTARKAAGKIHSDLERGFIRAEVIPYEVFMDHGSEQAVKEAGLLQVQGKDYVVGDADLLSIRFNV